ncbi:MAG TPA: hypothetical protein VKG80_08900 [Trebonia sp.]|nr:hypothetical protein [Trebonia sp.]
MGLIAIMLAAFLLAIGLVRLIGRLIDSDAPDGWADPPDTSDPDVTSGTTASTDPSRQQ